MNIVETFKALGDENRIRILNLLIKEELCVCEIETILSLNQSNASRHLNKLKNAGIVTSKKKSQWVYYRIDEKFIEENTLLYEFLKNNFSNNEQLKKDNKMLNKYKNSNLTCEHLKEDKHIIQKLLNEGNSSKRCD